MAQIVHNPVHKLVCNGGATLWMPRSCVAPSLEDPDIYAQSSSQLYPLGSKLEFADGRVFRYGKIGATSTNPPIARMVVNANLVPGSAATNGYEGTLDSTSDYAVGSTTLIMDDTTDRVKNWYEDGMLAVYPSGHFCEYRIAGNDAATSVDDVTIYLDDPLGLQTALVVSSTGITAYPSIFSNMKVGGSAGAGYESVVGVCLANGFTSAYFAWVQRKGRAIVTPTAYFGDTAHERLAMFWYADGTICAPNHASSTVDPSVGGQIIGYLTQRTVSGYGDLEVWLTLE